MPSSARIRCARVVVLGAVFFVAVLLAPFVMLTGPSRLIQRRTKLGSAYGVGRGSLFDGEANVLRPLMVSIPGATGDMDLATYIE